MVIKLYCALFEILRIGNSIVLYGAISRLLDIRVLNLNLFVVKKPCLYSFCSMHSGINDVAVVTLTFKSTPGKLKKWLESNLGPLVAFNYCFVFPISTIFLLFCWENIENPLYGSVLEEELTFYFL